MSAGATVAVPGGDPADDVAAVPVSIAAAAPWGCGPAGVLRLYPELLTGRCPVLHAVRQRPYWRRAVGLRSG